MTSISPIYMIATLSFSTPHTHPSTLFFFFFNDTAPTEIYTLSLHDALPISRATSSRTNSGVTKSGIEAPKSSPSRITAAPRSEEHTSELQSQFHLVCRLLLEKKKKKK